MARYVWALVHGIAMLGIDGHLREPGTAEQLVYYAVERLHTGIAVDQDGRRIRGWAEREVAVPTEMLYAIYGWVKASVVRTGWFISTLLEEEPDDQRPTRR